MAFEVRRNILAAAGLALALGVCVPAAGDYNYGQASAPGGSYGASPMPTFLPVRLPPPLPYWIPTPPVTPQPTYVPQYQVPPPYAAPPTPAPYPTTQAPYSAPPTQAPYAPTAPYSATPPPPSPYSPQPSPYSAPQPQPSPYSAPQPQPSPYSAPQPQPSPYSSPPPQPSPYYAPQPQPSPYSAPPPYSAGQAQPPVPASQGPLPQPSPLPSPPAQPPVATPAPSAAPQCRPSGPTFLGAPHGTTALSSQNTGYWFSWADKSNAQKSWTDAEQFCRQNCMTLVSLDQVNKTSAVASMLTKGDLFGIWTSGRVCNYAGCEKDPQSNGKWMWATKGSKVGGDPSGRWSTTGGLKKPQPDNLTGLGGGENEDCLAVLSNWYSDGTTFHDLPCSEALPFICERNLP